MWTSTIVGTSSLFHKDWELSCIEETIDRFDKVAVPLCGCLTVVYLLYLYNCLFLSNNLITVPVKAVRVFIANQFTVLKMICPNRNLIQPPIIGHVAFPGIPQWVCEIIRYK
jgi:hypothetical protein